MTSAWKTIETAPKDGTDVLITSKGIGMIVSIGRYVPPEHRKDWEPKSADWWRVEIGNGKSRGMRPSVWMPLPSPPGEGE